MVKNGEELLISVKYLIPTIISITYKNDFEYSRLNKFIK